MRNGPLPFFILTVVLMVSNLFVHFVYADTIILKDGRKIEGLIIEEQKDFYVVKITIGTIKLNKVDIREIKQLSKEENYLNLGNQYLVTQNYDAALEQYKKALGINPEFQPAKNAIAQIEKLKAEAEEKRRAELEKKERGFLEKKKRLMNDFGFELGTVDSEIKTVNIIKGSGADVAGLKKYDQIVQIDAKPTKGKSLEDIIDYLIEAEEKLHSFTIQREVNLIRKRIEYQKRFFVGVGIFLDVIGDNLIISSVIGAEPADLAGVKSKDKVISIDGKPTKGISLDEAAGLIGGNELSELKLTIERVVELEKI